jgi:pimeloyl-ACP methyl ester carboxylesterase/DNA-binding CsgD family transcriptional regulator
MPLKPHPDQDTRSVTSFDGTRIVYARTGSGPPLVQAGRWVGHLEAEWTSPVRRSFLLELGRRNTFYRYDSRGCGISQREVTDLSLDAQVRDLEAVVDAARLRRFPLLGMSGGGAVAITYAARHPERVSHLITLGAAVRGVLKRNATPKQIDEAMILRNVIQVGWNDQENPALRLGYGSRFMPDASIENLHAWTELQRVTAAPEIAILHRKELDQLDVTDELARVCCPTLIAHCRGDLCVPYSEGEFMAGRLPRARFVPLDGRNHIILENDVAWAQFFAELRAFIPTGPVRDEPSTTALTPRDLQLLELLAQGLDNGQIAARLDRAEQTVKNNITRLFDKLGIQTRPQAIVWARSSGFGRRTS